MIGRILSYLFCLRKLKNTLILWTKLVSDNMWAKIWNSGRAIAHMLVQHLEYLSTFVWEKSAFGVQGKLRLTVHGAYRMEKSYSFTEKMHGRLITIDRWSSMIDHTKGIYQGKIDMASKVNDDRPMVNYNRPRSCTQER